MRACYDQGSTQVGEWGMRVRLPAQQESKLQETPRWSSWAGGQVSRMEHMIKVNLASASSQTGWAIFQLHKETQTVSSVWGDWT